MNKKHFKRFAAAAVCLAVCFAVMGNHANATLVNSNTASKYTTATGSTTFYQSLITATGPDTTASASSNVITNLDGSIKDICFGFRATNQTGTSPTLTMVLQESYQATGPFFNAQTAQDQDDVGTIGDVDSAAYDISTASSTNVGGGVCASQFGRTSFAPYLRVRATVGGTGTPGWVGVVSAFVKK